MSSFNYTIDSDHIMASIVSYRHAKSQNHEQSVTSWLDYLFKICLKA